MAPLATAKANFDDAILRASALVAHAATVGDAGLRDDLLRGGWMMAAGGADAFFCDAYADLLSRTLRAKEVQASLRLTDAIKAVRLPISTLVGQSNGWRWRMAARQLIEKESVLSLKDIKSSLHKFCRSANALLIEGNVEPWFVHAESTKRVMGVTRANYLAANVGDKKRARESSLKHIERRVDAIFQRRHDCIHCCDRPKTALQPINAAETEHAISDLRFVVSRCYGHLVPEFQEFLRAMGATGVTRNNVSS